MSLVTNVIERVTASASGSKEQPFLVPTKSAGAPLRQPLGSASTPFIAPSTLSAFSMSALSPAKGSPNAAAPSAAFMFPPSMHQQQVHQDQRLNAFRVPLAHARMSGDGSDGALEGPGDDSTASESPQKSLFGTDFGREGSETELELRQKLLAQTEVNAELKKMLVASFGSDVAYRFERLAWDRTQFKQRSETLEE
jgi:hypothetical protein